MVASIIAPNVASSVMGGSLGKGLSVHNQAADVKNKAIPPISRSSARQDAERLTGLRHAANLKLEARHYKSPPFAIQLLEVLQILRVPSWSNPVITPQSLKIFKVSGSLTNAVFFVSCPSVTTAPTLLLRVYGPSSGTLISRPRELHTLHMLSSQYRIGPRVYGTFENGRVEEYFDSVTLTASDLRVKQISRWIGARMAELHSVDIETVEQTSPDARGKGKGWEMGVKKNVRSWLGPADKVLALPSVSDAIRKDIDLDGFRDDWNRYMKWLSETERIEGAGRTVFAHNDAQYGNLLKLTKLPAGTAEHRQLIVVDFEYASPNPAAFDIANHFHEWTANYHSDNPHVLDPSLYPTFQERRNFYLAYLKHSSPRTSELNETARELELKKLDREVRVWSPASHAMWAVWGIVQAREDLETEVDTPEFDYVGYAKCRFVGFRRGLRELGI